MRLRTVKASIVVMMLVLLTSPSDVFAARFNPIEIRLNGVVLLKGADSDSGERDFDQVWNNLWTVRFTPTEAFTKNYVKQDTTEVVLECTNKDAEKPDLVLDNAFGGTVRTRTLKIHRMKPDRSGREWELDIDQLKELTSARELPREQAARLIYPRGALAVKSSDDKQRSVRIKVTSNNIVLLEGTDQDDGRRDADAIWDNLPNVRLKGSDEFLKEHVNSDSSTVEVVGRVNVSHGGESQIVLFRVIRVKPDDLGRDWMLDPSDVKEAFENREISREMADRLTNPGRIR